jgi:hypothetical protein
MGFHWFLGVRHRVLEPGRGNSSDSPKRARVAGGDVAVFHHGRTAAETIDDRIVMRHRGAGLGPVVGPPTANQLSRN